MFEIKSGYKTESIRSTCARIIAAVPASEMKVGDYVELRSDEVPCPATFRSMVSKSGLAGFGVEAKSGTGIVRVIRKK